jgi:hypothetical protein
LSKAQGILSVLHSIEGNGAKPLKEVMQRLRRLLSVHANMGIKN